MKVRGLLIANILIAGAMALFGVWVAADLGADAQLPIHWNVAGEPDGFARAHTALLWPAGVSLLSGLLMAAIPRMEPLQDRLEASAPLLRSAWIGTMLLMVYVQIMIAAPALGWNLGPNLLLVGVGALLVMLGNNLPKSRPGFFVGIRTPWTLSDTDNWIATHRLGGKVMMSGGAVMILAALAPVSAELRTGIMLGLILAVAAIPIAYSWWLWRRTAG
ncbi:MAG: SdpI family protein [Porphyrobacter sp.]|nr:SdpI family protein [Porphyrobacter sp.]